MAPVGRRSLVRYAAAASVGGVAGVSRLSSAVPALVAVAGVLGGVVVGLGIDRYSPAYDDAIAAAAAGTVLYAGVLAVGALAGAYWVPARESARAQFTVFLVFEPLVFFPVFAVEAVAVAVAVKRLRVGLVGDDAVEFS